MPKRLSKSELVRELDISPSSLKRHLDRIGAPEPDDQARYDVTAVRKWVKHRQGYNTTAGSPDMQAARLEKLQAEAAVLRLKEAEMSGSMIRRDESEAALVQMSQTVRQQLMTLPNSLPPLLAGRPAAECADILQRAVRDCCRILAEGGE